ncbi:hypothetical protein ACFXOM_24020 [Streptomyces sp. NPDC059169]|uniref:hypothetical protein n=1 Tax=Streptomyces sp. NPDC059169 TaxID=3346754 RepID=UPI00368575AB
MADDARQDIAATLAETGVGEEESALKVLGLAFAWAAHAVRRVDDVASGSRALAALYALDDALDEGRALIAAVPGLLDSAVVGDRGRIGTEGVTRQLAEAAESVARERTALEELASAEEELRSRLAEHEGLRQQVAELRRLERLVVALDALQAQQRVIGERLAALRGRDAGVDEALRTSADALIRLSDDELGVLAPQTRQVLERAAAAQSALAAEERRHADGAAELAEAQDRLERIRAEQGALLSSLRLHAEADRDLARALTGPVPAAAGTPGGDAHRLTLSQVESAAADVEDRLRRADEALARVLEERDAVDTGGRETFRRTGG